MKYLLLNWHWLLINSHQYYAANKLFHVLNTNQKKGFLIVSASEAEFYNSGLMAFLFLNCQYYESSSRYIFFIDFQCEPCIQAA